MQDGTTWSSWELEFDWFDFKQTNSLFIVSHKDYHLTRGFAYLNGESGGKRANASEDITIYFSIRSFGVRYIREPHQLLDGFSKIGGLVTFLNIWVAVKILHKWRFERSLRKHYGGKDGRDVKEVFSIETFDRVLKKLKSQEREIESLKSNMDEVEYSYQKQIRDMAKRMEAMEAQINIMSSKQT